MLLRLRIRQTCGCIVCVTVTLVQIFTCPLGGSKPQHAINKFLHPVEKQSSALVKLTWRFFQKRRREKQDRKQHWTRLSVVSLFSWVFSAFCSCSHLPPERKQANLTVRFFRPPPQYVFDTWEVFVAVCIWPFTTFICPQQPSLHRSTETFTCTLQLYTFVPNFAGTFAIRANLSL